MGSDDLVKLSAAGGVALGGAIKLFQWFFDAAAKRSAERRTDLTTLLTRQQEELARQDEELAALRKEIAELERRVREAERETARMERVLYMLGYAKGPGGWKRNGDPEIGGTA